VRLLRRGQAESPADMLRRDWNQAIASGDYLWGISTFIADVRVSPLRHIIL